MAIALTFIILVLTAPFAGSFLGVLIRRLPGERPVVLARSACETCGTTLGPAELIPFLSHWRQKGCCRTCGVAIDPFHWQVELAATAVAGLSVVLGTLLQRDEADILIGAGLGWLLLALAWIDWRQFRLPDVLTLSLLLLGLARIFMMEPERLGEHALAAAIGYIGFRAIGFAYRLWRGVEGLGHGDAKLVAASGAWLGLYGLPDTIALASVSTLLAVLLLAPRPLTRDLVVPFGPGLCLAFWLCYWLRP